MKSQLCRLPRNTQEFALMIRRVDQFAQEGGLSQQQALHLHLLAEELSGMLLFLLKNSEGSFWMEKEGDLWQLRAELTVQTLEPQVRAQLLELSTTGRNAAASGLLGRLRSLVEEIIFTNQVMMDSHYVPNALGLDASDSNADIASCDWTLSQYRRDVKAEGREDRWDELEKSIIANLADDVSVGIRGSRITITVEKTFA